MLVRLVQPANATFELGAARPLPLSPHPLCQGDNSGVQKLAINLKQTKEVRLVVWLTPLPDGQGPPPGLPAVTPLADW